MRKILRPAEHNDFDAEVSNARSNVAQSIRSGAATDFPGLWSDFKDLFAAAQLGKCGFCEGQVHGLQYGDVEHFQPKAEVHELVDDPDYWGKEAQWKSTVKQRKTKATVDKPGYWWRAYQWDNYLLSCQICNEQWKKNLYPVKGLRVLLPTIHGWEERLLLSPFDDFDPAEHFVYGRLGEISGLTKEGHATIITCGLDRPSLRLARYKSARATHEHLDEIAGDLTEREMLRMLHYIGRDGEDTQPYCGMVRTIFTQRTDLHWEQLDQLVAMLEGSPTPERVLCDC
jgi:hypothetical protein